MTGKLVELDGWADTNEAGRSGVSGTAPDEKYDGVRFFFNLLGRRSSGILDGDKVAVLEEACDSCIVDPSSEAVLGGACVQRKGISSISLLFSLAISGEEAGEFDEPICRGGIIAGISDILGEGMGGRKLFLLLLLGGVGNGRRNRSRPGSDCCENDRLTGGAD